MTNATTVDNVRMSLAAAANVEETGCSPSADVARVRGGLTPYELLAECLDGADDDRADGWRDYVSSVVDAAAESA